MMSQMFLMAGLRDCGGSAAFGVLFHFCAGLDLSDILCLLRSR